MLLTPHKGEGDSRGETASSKRPDDAPSSHCRFDVSQCHPAPSHKLQRGLVLTLVGDFEQGRVDIRQFESFAPKLLPNHPSRMAAFAMTGAGNGSCQCRIINQADLAIPIDDAVGNSLVDSSLGHAVFEPGRASWGVAQQTQGNLPGVLGRVPHMWLWGSSPSEGHR